MTGTRASATIAKAMRRTGLFLGPSRRVMRSNLAGILAAEGDPITPDDIAKLAEAMTASEAEAKLADGTWRVWRRLERDRARRLAEDRQQRAIRGSGWTELDDLALARRKADELLELVRGGAAIRVAARRVGMSRQEARTAIGSEASLLGRTIPVMLRAWRTERLESRQKIADRLARLRRAQGAGGDPGATEAP